MPKDRFVGDKFTVIHCKDALESFYKALERVKSGKREAFKRGMINQIKRLADGHRMSKENFPQEGDLPKKKGQHRTKKFNALKRIPIRGYCWLSDRNTNTYYISHYVYKNYQNLKAADTNRVKDNWSRIEENGDEC